MKSSTVLHLRDKYFSEVVPGLVEKFGIKNPMNIPKIEKIVINTSLGQRMSEKAFSAFVGSAIASIAGQKPVVVFAKHSIAAFKLRQGMPIGYKVTLRKKAMYDFLSRFVYVALPRMRDFNGFSLSAMDSAGNFSVGISDCFIFPEIDSLAFDKGFGFNVSFCIGNLGSFDDSMRVEVVRTGVRT